MQRYPAFDPPEYVAWSPNPALIGAYRSRIESDPERRKVVSDLGAEDLLRLYEGLLRFRLHDIMLQRWVKQGVISKAWLGTGEEAVTIGAVHALRRGGGPGGDVCGPMIRNAGACHEMGMPLEDMFAGYLGSLRGPARGRDLHIGDPDRGIVAPVSVVGGLCGVMNGYALAFRRRREDRVALTWIGDGSTKSGEVHEALNLAAVLRLPTVFVLQNNQVALGTPVDRHHRSEGFAAWGRSYGVELLEVDGNNVLDVLAATTLAVQRCRRGEGPVFISVETFRMGGHATHDVREARALLPPELFRSWGDRDPIGQYEEYLAASEIDLSPEPPLSDASADVRAQANRDVMAEVERAVTEEVDQAAARALAAARAEATPASDDVGKGVYARHEG